MGMRLVLEDLSPLGVADRIRTRVQAEFCFREACRAKTKFGLHEWPDSVCYNQAGTDPLSNIQLKPEKHDEIP